MAFIDEYDSSNFKYFTLETAFNLDGSYALKRSAHDGVLIRKYAEYFAHGQPKQLGQFYNGFKTGKWFEYYPNGKLAAEYLFQLTQEDSIFNGLSRSINKDFLKVSKMRFEWGENDSTTDTHLKYINVIIDEYPYLSPTIPPIWKKYNLSVPGTGFVKVS